MNQLAIEDVQKKLREGKIEVVKSKKEREQEAVIQIGGGHKKGGKKPKPRNNHEEEDIFSNIDISLLNLFGFLKVSPPLNKETLAPKIAELSIKLRSYNEDGEKLLKEEEEKLMQGHIEAEIPEESKENYNQDHHHYDDRRRDERQRGGRGSRGGSGRGVRGGARSGRGGARDGERRRDDGDDDVYVSSGDESNK